MCYIIGVLKNFAIFTGKRLSWKLSRETPTWVFSCKICEIVKYTFFYRTNWMAASEVTNNYNRKSLKKSWLLLLKFCFCVNETGISFQLKMFFRSNFTFYFTLFLILLFISFICILTFFIFASYFYI